LKKGRNKKEHSLDAAIFKSETKKLTDGNR